MWTFVDRNKLDDDDDDDVWRLGRSFSAL